MSFKHEQVAQLLEEINQCCGKSDASNLEKVLSKTGMINLIDSTGNYKVVKCLSVDDKKSFEETANAATKEYKSGRRNQRFWCLI